MIVKLGEHHVLRQCVYCWCTKDIMHAEPSAAKSLMIYDDN